MKKWILILIFITAFLLRFIGTNPGYNHYHSDEPILYGTAVDMIRNGNLDPTRFDYPGVSIYINYLFYRTVFIPIGWFNYYISNLSRVIDGTVHIPVSPLEAKRILQVNIFGERETNVVTWGRYIAAGFSFGSVVLIYILAKKLLNKDVAIITAFFVAFNFRQILNSHVNLPDIYNCFFLLLSLIVSFNLWRKNSRKNYLLAGLAAGLAFSTKYQFFAFMPLAVAHFYNAIEGRGINFKKLLSGKIFLSFLVGLLAFLLTNPYFFPSFETAIKWITDVSAKYGAGIKKFNLYPFSYYYHIDMGPIEFVLVIIGIILAFVKETKKTILIFSALLPFFFLLQFYTNGGFYIRNYVTVTPILLMFAAFGIYTVYKFISLRINKKMTTLVLMLSLVLSIYIPGKNAIVNSYFNTKGWDYQLLSQWMYANIPAGSVIASHPFDPPTGTPDIKRTEFELGGSYSLAEHKENGAEYALMNTDWAGNNFYFWMNFGFSDVDKFWNKPLKIMRNTFFGLASEELMRWQIFNATKPWQAPDANLILAKIPVWPSVQMNVFKKFDFSGGDFGWQYKGNFDNLKLKDFHGDGYLALYPSNARFQTIRLASQPILINPGHVYRVDGTLKTDKILTPSQRDGFLRIDFYKDLSDLENIGIISSVSSRVYGTSSWIHKEITERAPDDAKYMMVSLQTANTVFQTVFLKEIVILESKDWMIDQSSKLPYIKTDLDLNDLYPNSHGNL